MILSKRWRHCCRLCAPPSPSVGGVGRTSPTRWTRRKRRVWKRRLVARGRTRRRWGISWYGPGLALPGGVSPVVARWRRPLARRPRRVFLAGVGGGVSRSSRHLWRDVRGQSGRPGAALRRMFDLARLPRCRWIRRHSRRGG